MDFSRILSHCRNTGKTHKINRAVSVVTFTDCVCIPSAPRVLYIFQLCHRAAGLLRSWAAVGLGAGAVSPFTLPFLKGCRVLPCWYCRRPTCVIALCRALRRRDRSPVCCTGQLHRGRHRAGNAAPQHCFGRVCRSSWATSSPVWKLCPRGVMRASAAGRVMCFSAETDKKAFPVSVYPVKDKPFTGFVSSQRRPHRSRPLSPCWVSCAAYSASLKGFYGRCRRSGAVAVVFSLLECRTLLKGLLRAVWTR